MNKLIEGYDIGPNRAKNAADFELKRFSEEDVKRILAQLRPLEDISGSNNPCGPVFNRWTGLPAWMIGTIWGLKSIGIACLLPIQIGAAIAFVSKGRLAPIWKELPIPTVELFDWLSDSSTFVKVPLKLVEDSISKKAAL